MPDDTVWTDRMNSDLLHCSDESIREFHSDNPPTYKSGNKVGIAQLIMRKWDTMGYRSLELPQIELQDQTCRLRLWRENDTSAVKKDGLKRVLEEFEKGHDVHINDVVNFIHELSGTDSESYPDEDIIERIKCKVHFDQDSERLNVNQCMEYLATELEIDSEDEVLKAFKAFDKNNTGKITPTDLKSIMEERGNPLTDEELRMFMKKFEAHSEGDRDHDDDVDFEDVGVDYRAFVKGIMEKIHLQEQKLWGDKQS